MENRIFTLHESQVQQGYRYHQPGKLKDQTHDA